MLTHLDPSGSYALYLHIPFCRRRCSYCAFYAEPCNSASRAKIQEYHAILLRELTDVTRTLQNPFETIYIGGGNPGLLTIDEIRTLLCQAHVHTDAVECTMEINPGSLTASHEQLFDVGLNRLSIGIQSMHERHLRTLGREATVAVNRKALALVRDMKKRNQFRLNLDLMTCIPGQSIADAIRDIDIILEEAEPDHLSVYNLTVEEGTSLARAVDAQTIHIIDEDSQYEMLSACWNHLKTCGFSQYEIANFSISHDHRSQHNQRYWSLKDYIGLGASAAGTLSTPDGRAIRTTSVASVDTYLRQPPWQSYSYELLTKHDLMLELILVGLRTHDGIDTQAFRDCFGVEFSHVFSKTIEKLSAQRPPLLRYQRGAYALTEQAFMLLDTLVLSFAEELDDTAP